jgi:uncharacterized membrane protein YczE
VSAATAALSRWRPGPGRLGRLLAGLGLFGAGEACLVASDLGNSPWTVLGEGVSRQTPLSIGAATVAISLVVLACWAPLRQRPGFGTVANALLVGLALDAVLGLLPGTAPLAVRVAELASGIVLVACGSGLYLGSRLGPGPRDGLMTGLHRRTGVPVGAVRGAIELSACAAGAILGGTVGVGTLVFALSIGPAVAFALAVAGTPAREL